MELKFDDNNYEEIISCINRKKSLMKELSSILLLDSAILKEHGDNNNVDNFQIFTPRFIVDDMIKAVGKDYISDWHHTVLEPTSGDGAFTCRILELRLHKIESNERDIVFQEVLNSLGTIYSIEMDKDLVNRQRNNIYTICMQHLTSKEIKLNDYEDQILRLVIVLNFIWAETNIDSKKLTQIICEVAYKMPEAEKGNKISLDFPVWNFKPNNVSLHYEAPLMEY